MPGSGGCFKCLGFVLTLGLVALFLWLALRTYKPTCSIKNFRLPALNQSLQTPANATIFMDLRLSNGNKEKGVEYDQINVTVRSFNDSNQSLWQGKVPGFYQGYEKKATKNVTVDASGVNWTGLGSRSKAVVFHVDLQTQVRFKIIFWQWGPTWLWMSSELRTPSTVLRLKSGIRKIGINSRNVGVFCGFLALVLLKFWWIEFSSNSWFSQCLWEVKVAIFFLPYCLDRKLNSRWLCDESFILF